MPCHESHTRGPGVDDYLADQNEPNNLALERCNKWWVEDEPTAEGNYSICWGDREKGINFQVAVAVTREIADEIVANRHRAEPEGTVPCERCRGTGARHVAGEPTQEPCGECSGEGVISKVTEHCGCDGPDCPTWQSGYEAQRERVGGGRA